MPGISGIIDFSSEKSSLEHAIKRMNSLLNNMSLCIEETICGRNVAFGTARLKDYPYNSLIAEDENSIIAFWGYLWDENELKHLLENGKDFAYQHVCHVILKLYRDKGAEAVCKLNGRFVTAIWHKKAQTLNLISDSMGFAKLYYWLGPNKFLFSSEYKGIIYHEDFPQRVDIQGLADFTSLGYCVENRTLLEGVKLLPKGTIISVEPGKMPSVQTCCDYTFYSEDELLRNEHHYIDEFYVRLETAIKRQLAISHNIGIPLSGGFDSRTLAGIVGRISHNSNVKALSYGHMRCLDVVYGRKIAKKVGFEHSFIQIGENYLRDYAEQFVWLMEGMVDCVNSHMLLTHPFIRNQRIDTIITGFLGDVLCGSGLYTEGAEGIVDDEMIIDALHKQLTDVMKEEDMASYMKGNIYRQVQNKIRERIKRLYYQAPTENKYFRIKFVNLHGRQRRYTSFNLHIFDSITNVVSPFLDKDFVQFILHVPSSIVFNRNLYKKMIVAHLPIVASVPLGKSRLPINASWVRKGLQWRWEKLNHNLLVRKTIGRRYAMMNDNYLNTAEAIRTGSKDFVIKHIKNNSFLAEYFNMDRVYQMLDDHMSGRSNEYRKLTAFLTLSLWHKLFIEKTTSTITEKNKVKTGIESWRL